MKKIIKNIYLSLRYLLLGLFFQPHKINQIDLNSIRSVLLIRLDRLGDLIVSLPVIQILRENFPQLKITILVRKPFVDLLLSDSLFDKIIVYNNFFSTLVQLRYHQYDLVIDLLKDNKLVPALLTYTTRAQYRTGYNLNGRGKLFNLPVIPENDNKKSMVEYELDLVRNLGIKIPPGKLTPRIVITDREKNIVKSYLAQLGISEFTKLATFHPGAYYPSQRWPIEKFVALADELVRRYKLNIIIVAGNGEESLIDQIVTLTQEKVYPLKNLPLRKLAVLFSISCIFIGNNSGPLHLACAVGTPTVSTLGPTVPQLWWPAGEKNIVVTKNLSCSPCNRSSCKPHECMEQITVSEMADAVGRILH